MSRRIRITDIALDHSGERFEEGDVLVVDGDTPLDLVEALQGRLDAGTAVDVLDEDALPAELVEAIAAFIDLAGQQHRQLGALIELGLAAGPAGAAAIMAAFQDLQLQAMVLAPGIVELQALAATAAPLIEPPAEEVIQQNEPAGDQAVAAGSGTADQAAPEASDAGGATDAEVSAVNTATSDTEAPEPPPGGDGAGQGEAALAVDAGGAGAPSADDPPAPEPAATTPRRSTGSKAKAK